MPPLNDDELRAIRERFRKAHLVGLGSSYGVRTVVESHKDVPALLAHAAALQEEVGLLRTGLLQVQAFASNINVPVKQEQILGQVLKLVERALQQAEAGNYALLAPTTALQTEIVDLKAHLKECHETWGECMRGDCDDLREEPHE